MDLASARRFYGLSVAPEVWEARREQLTLGSGGIDDLVDAHLSINFAYFGAIDKTLSGFVVLDDEGDDYTLFDARDSNQIWQQDHETRELALEYDQLADLAAVRTEIARAREAGEEVDRRVVQKAYRATAIRTSRPVPTSVLAARYQWLVFLLGQPLRANGVVVQSTDTLVRQAVRQFRRCWPDRAACERDLATELPQLAKDPHLAIYWLLHATMLADDAMRARVVTAIWPAHNGLVKAFVDRFSTLPLAGDVSVVPEFRARRASFLSYSPFDIAAEDAPAVLLRALEIDPIGSSIERGLSVTTGLDKEQLAIDAVTDVVGRIPDVTPGTAIVRSYLAKRGGAVASEHANTLARLVAGGALDPWWFAFEALWQVHELVTDGAALLAASRAVLAHDRYHRRVLQMARRAAGLVDGKSDDIAAIDRDLALAETILEPYEQLVTSPDRLAAILAEGLGADSRAGLAWRVVQRAPRTRPSPDVLAWAAGEILAGPEAVRAKQLVGVAIAGLDPRSQSELVAAAEAHVDRADHPLLGVLLAMLDGPEPAAGDFAAYVDVVRGREAAIVSLARWFHDPAVFEPVMAIVERPAGRSVQDPLWSKLFSPFAPDTYVVPRLDAAQAVRCAKAMIAVELGHPQIHARNSAGQAMYRFSPIAAERFLIAALVEYSAKLAGLVGVGAMFDHGKTEREQLEAVTTNLYNAVVGLDTPAARVALVERLAGERRSYWQLGAAIAHAFDATLHVDALAAIDRARDGRAAGAYAYALAEHVKSGPSLVELARVIVGWDSSVTSDTLATAFLHYALIACEKAALDAHDAELVRAIEKARATLLVDPVCPDDHGRGTARWRDPFDDEDTRKALAHAMSGAADREKAELVQAGIDARVAGKPNFGISDEALGKLAGTTVELRLHVDRTTGAIWFRDAASRAFVFDGYEIIDSPFESAAIGPSGIAEMLEGATRIDARAMWWDDARANYREALLVADRIVLSWGADRANPTRQLFAFADRGEAQAAMAGLRAHPMDGYTACDPYYVDGKGAVVRTYYVPGEGAHAERKPIWTIAREASAIAEHERIELMWMLERDATLTCIECSAARRRVEDLTVREWIAARFRDDTRDAVWHLEALEALGDYLDAHGLRGVLPELELQLGTGARSEDIDALEAERAQPVPAALRDVWKRHGRATWRVGEVGRRLLGPREVLARRDAAGADVIVEALDGTPVTVVGDFARDDGRVYAHVGDFWWESSLSLVLAARFLGDLEAMVIAAAPQFERLGYGQRGERHERGVYLERVRDGMFWEAIVDLDSGRGSIRFGKIDQGGVTTIERVDPESAGIWLDARAAEKWEQGYRNPVSAEEEGAGASPPRPTKRKGTKAAKPTNGAGAKPTTNGAGAKPNSAGAKPNSAGAKPTTKKSSTSTSTGTTNTAKGPSPASPAKSAAKKAGAKRPSPAAKTAAATAPKKSAKPSKAATPKSTTKPVKAATPKSTTKPVKAATPKSTTKPVKAATPKSARPKSATTPAKAATPKRATRKPQRKR